MIRWLARREGEDDWCRGSELPKQFSRAPNQTVLPPRPSITVLPLDAEVLSGHLAKIKLPSEPEPSHPSSKKTSSILLDPYSLPNGQQAGPAHRALARAPPPTDNKTRLRKLKRDQRQMAHLTRQAGSLTGASGVVLQQQVIVAAPPSTLKSRNASQSHSSNLPPSSSGGAQSKGGKAKAGKAPVLSKAEQIRQANTKQKASAADASADTWWRNQLEELKKLPEVRQQSALELLFRSPKAQEDWLRAEMTLYRLDLTIRSWVADPKAVETAESERYRVQILADVKSLSVMKGCTPTIRKILIGLLKTFGLSDIELPTPLGGELADRAPLFSFTKTWSKSKDRPSHAYFPIQETPIEFQLRAFGEHMDRSMDSRPDARTSFDPDAWQATVLDKIDQRSSMLVVAPTSAG